MARCTCKRKGLDMTKDEHFITCPKVLTPEVLEVMGFTEQMITVRKKIKPVRG